MTPTLTVLIPTLVKRRFMLDRLLSCLLPQCEQFGVLISPFEDEGELTIGEKRNGLIYGYPEKGIEPLETDYGVFIDDDDMVSESYIMEIMSALQENPDCVTFRGLMQPINAPHEEFTHRLGYEYREDPLGGGKKVYSRPPNHLNPMRSDIMRAFPYPAISSGEDTDVCLRIQQAGVLQTEVFIDKVLYYYLYRAKK